MVYDSKLHLFSGKFKSRWFGPCVIKRDLGHGAFELQSSIEGTFKVNGQRLKHYRAGEQLNTEESKETNDGEAEEEPNASSAADNQ